MAYACGLSHASYATSIPLTVNLDQTVIVTGSPRLQLDVGGVTRYAPYASGSGTNTLSFAYPVTAPDFDRDGITLVSPLDVNGGTIRDVNGNDADLTFVPPNTSGVRLQSYTVLWTTSPVTAANETATAFDILNAPLGATYNYTITSSGGGGNVTGSGSIAANPQSVTGVDVSSLSSGTLTLSVTVTNATGTGNAKTNTVSGVFTGILDSLPASAAAYSVRRLRSAYTGPLLRVRRSSDNTEQDIGPTLGGNLNTTTLTSFCGTNSCFIRTWYDQSGNARDATQTTNTNQPRIVNAGAVETQSARPIPLYDGVDDWVQPSGLPTTSSLFATIIASSTTATWNSFGSLFSDRTANGFIIHNNQSLSNVTPYVINSSGAFTGGNTYPASTITNLNIYSLGYDGSVMTPYTNGIAGTGAAVVIARTNSTMTATGIGKDSNIAGRHLAGRISEAMYWASNQTPATVSTLSSNQKTYYSIP
jgi:Alpha-L-arabinofuranosidase B, catalytic